MMYGLGEGCNLAVDKDGDVQDLDFHLPGATGQPRPLSTIVAVV